MRSASLLLLAALSPSLVHDARAGTLKVPLQHATIQAAVDAAVPGDVVKIAAGTYTETVRVFSTHSIELLAEGKVTIDAYGLPGPGVQLASVTGVRLRGLRVVDSTAEGFLLLGSEAVVLEDCRSIDAGTYGVRATSSCRAVLLDRPTIRGAALAGVMVENATFVSVRDGRFEALGGPGVETATFSSHATVTGGRFDVPGWSPILARGHLDVIADNRTVSGGGQACILEGSAQAAVGNRGATSVVVKGTTAHVIDNRCSPTFSEAITVWGGAGVVAYGNRSKGPNDVGLFDAGTDTVFASNRAKGVGSFGMLLYGSSDAVFSGNRIAGKLGWAVGQYATSTGAVFLANDVKKKKGALGGVIGDGTAASDLYAGNSFEGDGTPVLHVPGEHPTIQNAVIVAPTGAVIVVEAGVYQGDVAILGKHDLEIRAKGKVVIDSASYPGPGLEIDSSSEIVVRGLRFRNEGSDGVVVNDSVGVELEKVRVEDVYGAGIRVTGASRGVRFSRCRVSGTGAAGIRLEAGRGVHVDRCRLAGIGGTPIESFAATRACVLERNRIDRESASSPALVLDGVGHVVDRTKVTGTPNGLPIRIAGTDHTVLRTKVAGEFRVEGAGHRILDNRITRGPVDGLVLDGAVDCLVADNRVIRSNATGIELNGAARNRIVGNRVVRSDGNGIFVIYGSSKNVLAHNVVKKADGNGIVFGGGTTDNVALANTAKKSDGVDGWDPTPAGDNRWVANTFGTSSSIP